MSSQQPPTKKSKQVENKQGTLLSWVKPCTSDTEPGVVEETIQIKEQPESNCLQIFRERYPKQVLYIVKVNTNGKLETRTKDIVDKFSDLTCTKKYALTEGPANLMWATHSTPPPPPAPSHFILATGLNDHFLPLPTEDQCITQGVLMDKKWFIKYVNS